MKKSYKRCIFCKDKLAKPQSNFCSMDCNRQLNTQIRKEIKYHTSQLRNLNKFFQKVYGHILV